MTEVLLRMAEECFLAKKYVMAYDTAKTALILDPFYGNECIHKYVGAFWVHVGALFKNEDGEIDWYKVLGITDCSVPTQVLAHRFCFFYKLIHPDHHSSAAAKGAIQLLGNAFDVLGDSETRATFHKRWNLPPFPQDPPDPSTSTSKVVVASAASKPSSRSKFDDRSRLSSPRSGMSSRSAATTAASKPSSRSKFDDRSRLSSPRSGVSSRSAATTAAIKPKETAASSRSKSEDHSHAHSVARSSMHSTSAGTAKTASAAAATKSKETATSSRSKFEDRSRTHSIAKSAAPFRNQKRLRSLNNCSVSSFKRESGRSRPFAATRSIW